MIIYVFSIDSNLRRLHRQLSYLCSDRFLVDHPSLSTKSLVCSPCFDRHCGFSSNLSNLRIGPCIRISSIQLIECPNVRSVSPPPLSPRSPPPCLRWRRL